MRNPTDPIPGFEESYTGTVGKEKAVHHTHFHNPGVRLTDNLDTGNEWVRVGVGRYKLVRKRNSARQTAEVQSGILID